MEVKDKLEKELESLGDNFVILLDVKAENYSEAVLCATEFMLKKGKKGVYVAASRPYKFILKEMGKRNIETENLLFIDCISGMGGERDGGEICTYVENPAAIEEIIMHVSLSLRKLKSRGNFLIMDSISTLLIYNTLHSMEEFSMFLINKMRLEDVSGILIIIEKQVPEELEQILTAMCDGVIHV
jgi:KaiC/GvpD/RAD55 family RecA-like ATPase